MIAINDAFILESAIYFFLKKYFRQDPYYIDIVELFHEVNERRERIDKKKKIFFFAQFNANLYFLYRSHLKLN
jgi:hypothetical protein